MRLKPCWIVVSDFATFRIYDMEEDKPTATMQTVKLVNLPGELYWLQFLTDDHAHNLDKEE